MSAFGGKRTLDFRPVRQLSYRQTGSHNMHFLGGIVSSRPVLRRALLFEPEAAAVSFPALTCNKSADEYYRAYRALFPSFAWLRDIALPLVGRPSWT